MSSKKQILKELRKNFNKAAMSRDAGCRMCNALLFGYNDEQLTVHHITNREKMPNYGYAPSNGITLCPNCHWAAEEQMNMPDAEYGPNELYKSIGSSYKKAYVDSYELYNPVIWYKGENNGK